MIACNPHLDQVADAVIKADFDTWHYPYVRNVGSIFPEHPSNCRLADQYTIHMFVRVHGVLPVV
jgi:hypothetical protein